MFKIVLLYILFSSFLFSECYEIGETMNLEDQNTQFDICYGNYPHETFKFSDLNGALNGGNFKVILVRMNAVW